MVQSLRTTIVNFLSHSSTRKGLTSMADQVAASLTNFLTGVIIGRTCSQEEFGLYMLCYSTILLVADIQMSLISAPYMVYCQRLSGKDLHRYNGSIFLHQMVLSLILILLLLGGAALSQWSLLPGNAGTSQEYTAVFYALALSITFILLRDYIRKVCFAGMHMLNALVVDVTSGILQLIGLFVLAHLGLLSTGSAFLAVGAACGVIALAWFWLNRDTISFDGRHSLEDFRKNWNFAKWVFLSGLLWALGMTLYPWFLTMFHGTAANGVWGACFAVAALGNPLRLGVQNFLGPKVVEAYTKSGIFALWRFVLRSTLLFAVIILPFSLTMAIFGDSLVVLIYGAKYGGNGLIIAILGINLMVLAATFSISRAFLAIERSDLFFTANFVPLVILVTIGLFLVKLLGPLGVAISQLCGSLVTSIVMFYLFSRVLVNAKSRTSDQDKANG